MTLRIQTMMIIRKHVHTLDTNDRTAEKKACMLKLKQTDK